MKNFLLGFLVVALAIALASECHATGTVVVQRQGLLGRIQANRVARIQARNTVVVQKAPVVQQRVVVQKAVPVVQQQRVVVQRAVPVVQQRVLVQRAVPVVQQQRVLVQSHVPRVSVRAVVPSAVVQVNSGCGSLFCH